MEAATREERRLMRQRGAGTRKIQEVDFGFSFGALGAPPPSQPPTQPQPKQQQQNRFAPLENLPQGPDTTPETQKQLPPPESARRSSQTKLQTPTTRRVSGRRSPGSSRNGQASSIYDIPPDSPQNLSSSAKRRRIGPGPRDGSVPSITENEPVHTNGIASNGVQNPEPSSEQAQSSETMQPPTLPASAELPHRSKTQTPQLNDPSSSIPPANKDDGPHTTLHEQTPTNNTQNETPSSNLQQSIAQSSSKPQGAKSGKKTRRRKSTFYQKPKPRRTSDESSRRTSGTSEIQQDPEPEPEPEIETNPEPELPEMPQRSPARKRRKSKSTTKQPEVDEEDVEPPAVEERQGSDAAEEPADANETAPSTRQKKVPKRRKGKSVLQKKPKPKAPRPPSVERQSEEENEVNVEVEAEEHEDVDKSTPEAEEPSQPTQSRSKRGQPSTKRRRSLETVREEPEDHSEYEEQRQEAPPQEEAAPRKKPRRARQTNPETESSRKNTFPVTVHRLANVSALDADAVSELEETPNEADSADELSARQKFPNRGGVNAADVLSQICRETLDKTLSALENGIANESQAARRAEFTRKRKAVEAFSAELEGRLFDMSEVLDSNFALAMNLRRAKREMGEARMRLMDIRRQREEIGLTTDEVRRRHLEEERVQTQHNTVNNSLHSLELAIDRDQRQTDSQEKTNPAVGLEFLLRSVADDVSSTAAGSQGGLLNQIKNFNARLEERVKGGAR
ncbi:hypothetical protein FQN54_003819 [Arachnomyces sp. PD_36]|nr:hypothetical protein FQN54_003819 [Arachnomyces sp. PD_36]